ncbi:MAG TPA: HEAT repeat domain-containing protein [Kiritimatiellia bacterium]|nr:HEAT repeat domain-containing protein [Kiritimatiellia bacterium]HRZ12893.1 HEAT repeat domain-containing protein [Kiritimatiellia bacterium]HSA18497.1 HEAT repeat domain-containing protein [Kiritimatiellia bacterium]
MRCFTDPWRFGKVLGLAGLLAAARSPAAEPPPDAAPATGVVTLVWFPDLNAALNRAEAEYRPVVTLFTSPGCGWCRRLKAETLDDPEVRKLLQHFALVEIDVMEDPDSAQRYSLRGVPTLLFLASDGRVRGGVSGYVSAPELCTLLQKELNPEFLAGQDAPYRDLLKALDARKVPDEMWPAILAGMGEAQKRTELRDRIFALKPFPSASLVERLKDARLAVRLGALEILEEMAGASRDFDPWQSPEGEANREPLRQWQEWASGATGAVARVYAVLTPEEIRTSLLDLVSDHRERSLRAMRLLEHGGPGTADAVAAFLSGHPDLPAGARGRIRELQYVLLLPELAGTDVRALAHRLVFGNLDTRLKAIQDLPKFRAAATIVLADALEDPEPLIREAAVDSLARADPRRAMDILGRHVSVEKDNEVVFAILRVLGGLTGRKGLDILSSYLQSENEDLVVAALQSLGRLKTQGVSDKVGACLKDTRWRVRAAALEAAASLKANSLADQVMALLDDPDPFVRDSAIHTLAALGAKRAAGRLEKLFLENDELKGPIVSAFLQMELRLPVSFQAALKDRPPNVLLSVIEAVVEDGEFKDLSLIAPLTDHPDLDVACAAIQPLAQKGMSHAPYRQRLADILRAGQPEKVVTVLESIEIEESNLSPSYATAVDFDALGAEGGSGAGTNSLTELFEAFKPGGAEPPAPAPAPAETGAAGGLLKALGFKTAAPARSAVSGPDSLADAVQPYAGPEYEGRTRFAAALLLTSFGQTGQVAFLQQTMGDRTEDERQQVAQCVRPRMRDAFLPLLDALLDDESSAVRVAAVSAAVERGGSRGLERMMAALLRPGGRLKPGEVYSHDIESVLRRQEARPRIRECAMLLLQQSNAPPRQALGLVLLQKTWQPSDRTAVWPFLYAGDPWVRRAAFHALGQNDKASFRKVLDCAVADSSEYVRAVVPKVYERGMSRWTHYFSLDEFEADQYYWSVQDNSARLQDMEVAALRTLAKDADPRIRIESLMALLSNRQGVDLAELVRAAEAVPDRRAVADRLGRYLTDNSARLGPEFSVLLPFLDESEQNESQKEKVRKILEKNRPAGELPVVAALDRPIEAVIRDAQTAPVPEVAAPSVRVIFFRSYGCRDCERAEAMFPQLREVFPGLQIDIHDIRKTRAMSLNEALCERFGVPDRIRLVTPALFTAAGYSIKEDITFARLGELLTRSAGADDAWSRVEEAELDQAAASIGSRYRDIRLGVIAAAGLLDGVNPCAFATIIFLLSYLQVTRRTSRQIAQVGLAFIAGVFVAYYAMGLGLVEIVSRLGVLRRFSLVVNLLLAAFTLLIAILSVRDGIRCLRGRLADITLQLPGFLKDRIHTVIREGARHARFVAAAFVAGLVVSVLELACTGQVYAPTILFMLKTGEERFAAMGYLLAYNAAFVAPLFVVFALAVFGLRSDALIRFMNRHAAGVKFATAGLFLLLFAVFVWSLRG